MAIKPGVKERECLGRLLALARSEDLGSGDVTSALLPGGGRARATFVAREELVLCGGAFLGQIAQEYDPQINTSLAADDGTPLAPGDVLGIWSGPAGAVLAAERVALNFIQHLAAIATLTRTYVDAVADTGAAIYDTRKTTPGWRELEKYAVRTGGGRNHRMGLYDAILIKDNHLAILGMDVGEEPLGRPLAERLGQLGDKRDTIEFVELEVDTLDQLAAGLKLPVDVILLDNMSTEQMSRAVAMRDEAGLLGKVQLEASGSVTLETLRAVAETGVERIAVGAITHSAGAVDIGMDIEIQ